MARTIRPRNPRITSRVHRRRDDVDPELLYGFLFVGGEAQRRQGISPIFRIRFDPYVGKETCLSQDRLYPSFRKKRPFVACEGNIPHANGAPHPSGYYLIA
jgi:hypothetical protein